jgi:predicted helicase
MQHMLSPNLALICTRQTNPGDFTEILAANALVDKRALASFSGEARAYPLYLYDELLSFDFRKGEAEVAKSEISRPNLSPTFLRNLAAKLQIQHKDAHGLPIGLTTEDIFYYVYAVFHSPTFRSRYAVFLQIDFPRLPLTGNLKLFRALARLGGELVSLHLLESPKLDKALTTYTGSANPEVEKPTYAQKTVWLDKEQTCGFKGVPEIAWGFHIGGYQVCEKWLKDRKGRTLSKDDIAHYNKIIVALSETIRLMKKIDEVIDEHGGWPRAFQSNVESLSRAKEVR